jgi:peptide/nickel transport system permease protein
METAALGPASSRGPTRLRSLRRDYAAVLGLFVVAVWVATALIGPFMWPGDPNEQNLAEALRPPSWRFRGAVSHALGTDQLGRDMLTRIVHGARTSLVIALLAVGLAAVLGTGLGVIGAEWAGWVDEAVMRLADIQLSVPFILLAITVLALLGGSLPNMVLVLVLSGWVIYARVIRSELLHVRELDFVLAARAVGAHWLRIALRHLLPTTLHLVIVLASLELANVVVLEAALSFLGVGIRPPNVSWGTMLADGRDYLTDAWWLTTFPGMAITVIILGINLVGDWTRDLLDPRRRHL